MRTLRRRRTGFDYAVKAEFGFDILNDMPSGCP